MAESRILIVDDEPDIRLMLRLLLESQGYMVDEAADGLEALESLRTQHYGVMFLDLLMPNLGGKEVLERLPPELKDTMPVVVLTALNTDRDVLSGYRQGATLYLTKPFSNDNVIDTLNYLTTDLTESERLVLESRL
ncbi:MAG: response regulator [Myxococcota bacterium]|nr:response regulator [Myxococcota bacterium]